MSERATPLIPDFPEGNLVSGIMTQCLTAGIQALCTAGYGTPEGPTGDGTKDALLVSFDGSLNLEFHGFEVTNDAGAQPCSVAKKNAFGAG
ncbi:MAG: hypothetical protein KF859_11470 [Phycisphaeraceae bacterium]|nr:hypothetical protein [Phycisphaeraceae bacterium]